jgi:hypothetical protein
MPTVPPEVAAAVAQAYLNFFQVRADALFALDGSQLDEVATGDALTGLESDIEQKKAAGHAIRIDVVHNYKVIDASDDLAEVADDYRDSSVFIDPETKQLLPGESVPSSPDDAPEVKVIYQLQNINGVWKVSQGQRYQ